MFSEWQKLIYVLAILGPKLFCLFVCFCGRLLSKELGIPIGILPTSGAGVDGNAPYQAQELHYNPGQSWEQTSYFLGRFNPNTT